MAFKFNPFTGALDTINTNVKPLSFTRETIPDPATTERTIYYLEPDNIPVYSDGTRYGI